MNLLDTIFKASIDATNCNRKINWAWLNGVDYTAFVETTFSEGARKKAPGWQPVRIAAPGGWVKIDIGLVVPKSCVVFEYDDGETIEMRFRSGDVRSPVSVPARRSHTDCLLIYERMQRDEKIETPLTHDELRIARGMWRASIERLQIAARRDERDRSVSIYVDCEVT